MIKPIRTTVKQEVDILLDFFCSFILFSIYPSIPLVTLLSPMHPYVPPTYQYVLIFTPTYLYVSILTPMYPYLPLFTPTYPL